jgi:hypothetical protein
VTARTRIRSISAFFHVSIVLERTKLKCTPARGMAAPHGRHPRLRECEQVA